ncbi:MAG: NDMA-dependent alcohol dehydrogenase [Frankiales bacterium]|nr:NDMA-dependent alcohol dehydrogenase [Frankiales bacterium]
MKTRAAVMWEAGKSWDIVELDLDAPKAGEVLVKFVASGMCHSDDHLRTGDLPSRYPIVGGHEGAGIVEAVGEGVFDIALGDHIVCSFLPTCGKCRWCSTGHQNLCDMGALLLDGCLPDGTFRFHSGEQDLGGMCMLGTFSERAVVSRNSVVKIDDDLPLEKAALVGCGVPTGWGSAVYSADITPGDTVVIFGIGGIGINAVQGAKHAGARHVIAVDPIDFKRTKALEFGATHAVSNGEEAIAKAFEVTNGVGADSAIVTVGVVDSKVVEDAFSATRKLGTTVVVGLGPIADNTIQLNGTVLTLYQKTVKGSLFGSSNPMHDIKNILSLYRDGQYKLDELVTKTYSLDDINAGYEDMAAGVNIRGVITYDA